MQFKRFRKILKVSGITFLSLVCLIFILPELFPGFVSRKIREFVNHNIEGELNFGKARLSFLKHFPALTLSIYDFSLKGSNPFSGDTLLAGKEFAFGLDLTTLFSEELAINQFYLIDGLMNIQVDSLGNANYNVVKSTTNSLQNDSNANSSGASLRIKKIIIRNTRLMYNDRSLPMELEMDKLDYTGKGDLSKDIVDLASELTASGINFSYDGEPYAVDKKLAGGLVTRINTQSLELSFTRNDLKINQLPIDFKGFVRFPESGYDIDLRFKSLNADLVDVVSVLPPAYLEWMKETELKGTADLFLDFVGTYRASQQAYPTITAGIDLHKGYVRHQKAPVPISDLTLHMRLGMPALSTDSFYVDADTLHLALGSGFIRGNFHSKGATFTGISSRLHTNADLGQLVQAAGIKDFLLKGRLIADLALDPQPINAQNRTLPFVDARVEWKDGAIKTGYYPDPIEKINMSVVVENKSGTYHDMNVELLPISFEFAGKPFFVKADVKDFDNVRYDVTSTGTLDLGEIAKVFVPREYGVNIQGLVETNLKLKGTQADAMAGRLDRLKNSGTLVLKNIHFNTKDFPYPLIVENGHFFVNQDKLIADNLLLKYGRNYLQMKGYYNNLFPYLVGTGQLQGGLSLMADKLYLDEFLASTESEKPDSSANMQTPASSGVALVPQGLSLKLDARIKEAYYDEMKFEDVKGAIRIDNGKMLLENAGMRIAGSKTTLNAAYGPTSTSSAMFDFDIKADSFDIHRFYKEVPLFAEMAPSAKTVKGQVSLKYKLAGKLNRGMMPVMPSLKGGGTLSLHNVQVKGLKLFSAVAKKAGRDSLNNPNLKAVNLNTTIANNIMTLERTRMRIMGFRPRLEGQATLDGRLNLRFRLGLPPFGIIGIPMTITGTMENPNVQMRKGKEEDELEETEDAGEAEETKGQ